MHAFVRKYADVVPGCVSGFDRLVLRGTLRSISYVDGMRAFLSRAGVLLEDFGKFANDATECLKQAALAMPRHLRRPIRYLESPSVRKDLLARQIAEQDGIDDGLICVLTAVEPCWSFDIRRDREEKRLELVKRRRKCLFLYCCFLREVFGFCHVRLQTWFPFDVQVWVNGREWLSRQMEKH